MRGRLRHSSAHASPARGERLTVRALPAILSVVRWCLIVALSLRTSDSECKVMLETIQQPKPLNAMQAAHPLSSVVLAGLQEALQPSGQQMQPFPIISFFPVKLEPSNLSPVKLPVPACVHFGVFSMVTRASWAAWFGSCTKLQRVLGWVWVFRGDSRIWPWPTHDRFPCVLVTCDTGSRYGLGRKYFQAREKTNWEGFLKAFIFSSNLQSPQSYLKLEK